MTSHSLLAWSPSEALAEGLNRWIAYGWIRPLDFALAQTLHRLAPEPNPLIWILTVLVSRQSGLGHSCLPLADLLLDSKQMLALDPLNAENRADHPAKLLRGLTEAEVSAQIDSSRWFNRGEGDTPLTFNRGRCYLTRLYRAEREIEQQLTERLQNPLVPSGLPPLQAVIESLFPPLLSTATEPDWQRLATALALQQRLLILTGGPGTGKTATVVKLLRAIQQIVAPYRLTIRLAAPTGKAAARLTESIRSALLRWNLPLQSVPTEATTLHQLLGASRHRHTFRFNREQPLPADLVVVDEASMVDLELMAALLRALTPECRLILLGDHDQLASVEAGTILGDLCRGAEAGGYWPTTLARLTPFTPIDLSQWSGNGSVLNQGTVMLRQSYRFSTHSGIGELASAVNRGQAERVIELLEQGGNGLHLLTPKTPATATLQREWIAGYGPYLAFIRAGAGERSPDEWALAVLERYTEFQLLAALRQGEWGSESLNQQIATQLAAAGLLQSASGWPVGRPVIIQSNLYSLGLMNGDIGMTLIHPTTQMLRVAFKRPEGGVRWLAPNRLSAVESAFVLTVHKAQGSEFNHCSLILPPYFAPILTRELLYTGITRARQQLTLIAPDLQVIKQTVTAQVRRSSGLGLERGVADADFNFKLR